MRVCSVLKLFSLQSCQDYRVELRADHRTGRGELPGPSYPGHCPALLFSVASFQSPCSLRPSPHKYRVPICHATS